MHDDGHEVEAESEQTTSEESVTTPLVSGTSNRTDGWDSEQLPDGLPLGLKFVLALLLITVFWRTATLEAQLPC